MWWDTHRVTVLRTAIVILALYAAAKLGDEFRRLLFQYDRYGAVDLRGFQTMVKAWFVGRPVYEEFVNSGLYPPATYVLGYPVVGWLDFTSVRWVWAVTSILALALLAILLVRASLAMSRLEQVFVVLMLLATNATGVSIGNGQRILHLLPLILISLTLLSTVSPSLIRELGAAALYLFALLQPTVAVPFGWFVLFSPRGWRPLGLVAIGYAALTVFAASLQMTDVVTLLRSWVGTIISSPGVAGYANLTNWFTDLGLRSWSLVASTIALLGLGFWIYRYRSVDRWVLLGVTAIVARFWIYHRVYDDVLVVLAMLALFRIAKQESQNSVGVLAGVLLAVTIAAMLMLASWESLPAPLHWIYVGGKPLVWILDLIFLLAYAHNNKVRAVTA